MHPENRIAIDAQTLALAARRAILHMTHLAQSSHVGSALSVVDVLSVLYSGGANITPETSDSSERDCVILSKGHAASALYAVLALKGFYPEELLAKYCADGGQFGGHITHHGKPGVELSTGSLGHGFPYGLGVALSQKKRGSSARTFVVISDGECDEGTTWESALLANQFGLDNLTVIIDRNRIQSLTFTEDTVALEPLADKWAAFNWDVRTVNGHSYADLAKAMHTQDRPLCIIAETTKGKGVSFMENKVLWHYRPPSIEDLDAALLEMQNEDA